jgi:hypothetical protein
MASIDGKNGSTGEGLMFYRGLVRALARNPRRIVILCRSVEVPAGHSLRKKKGRRERTLMSETHQSAKGREGETRWAGCCSWAKTAWVEVKDGAG